MQFFVSSMQTQIFISSMQFFISSMQIHTFFSPMQFFVSSMQSYLCFIHQYSCSKIGSLLHSNSLFHCCFCTFKWLWSLPETMWVFRQNVLLKYTIVQSQSLKSVLIKYHVSNKICNWTMKTYYRRLLLLDRLLYFWICNNIAHKRQISVN